jgi:hypothetical protein
VSSTVPISYVLDPERRLIRTTCAGEVTLEEVWDHFEALVRQTGLPERLDVLLDLRSTTSLPTGEQVRAAAGSAALLSSRLAWGACAVIASSDALFGMSRVFEAYAGELFERIAVFRDLAEATAWLAGGAAAEPGPTLQ